MRHLPRSTILLGLVLIALLATLVGFAVARRSTHGSVQTRVAHRLVADFQSHVGVPAEHGVPLSTPGFLEMLLLVAIAGVALALWRTWPSARAETLQQRSDRPRS